MSLAPTRSVILRDATNEGRFQHDEYFKQILRPKSVLCTPLVKQGKLTGLLYMENNLTTGASPKTTSRCFACCRRKLRFSLENATLYRRLEQETVARMQLIMDAKLASLSAMMSGVAHELRNPLNFIMNFAESSESILSEMQGQPSLVASLSELERAGLKQDLNDLVTNMGRIRDHGKRANAVIQGMIQHADRPSGSRSAADLNEVLARSIRLACEGYQNRDFKAQVREDTIAPHRHRRGLGARPRAGVPQRGGERAARHAGRASGRAAVRMCRCSR